MQIWSYAEEKELVSQKMEEEQTKRNQSCVYVTTKKQPSSIDLPSPVTSYCVLPQSGAIALSDASFPFSLKSRALFFFELNSVSKLIWCQWHNSQPGKTATNTELNS